MPLDMDSDEIIKLIDRAFKNVKLGGGIGIYEAEAVGNYAGNKKTAKARKKDREEWLTWQEIPHQVIDVFFSGLCFVDAEGMRFLLPAYMKFALEYHEKSDSNSVDSAIYALDRGPDAFGGNIEMLTEEQRYSISQFLKHMVLVVGDDCVDAFCASQAYEKYWAKCDANMA